MWIVPTLVGFVVLAWLGYAWMNALFVKYEHTSESVALLAVVAAGSLLSGWKTAGAIAPGWSIGPKAAVTLGVGFSLFSLFSFMVVSLWTSLLTRRFDEAAAVLDEEEDSILRKLDAMRWDSLRAAGEVRDKGPGEELRRQNPREELRRIVEVWEQGGGAARIRSLKVLEWQEEAAAKSAQEVKDDIRSFGIEMSMESDETKKEQLRARLAVSKLALIDKEPAPTETVARKDPKPEMGADEAAMRERLQEIHRELQTARNAKAQYLRNRVKLGWRAGE